MKIALLGYRSSPFSGGQGIYLHYLSRALTERGHEVDVISGEPYPHLDDGIRLVKLPGLNLYQHEEPWRGFSPAVFKNLTNLKEYASVFTGGFPEPYTFGKRVFNYLKDHRHEYDIVHDNQTLSWGVLKLQDIGVPLVTTIHHPITRDLEIALAQEAKVSMRLLIRRWHMFLRMQTRVAQKLHHIVTVSSASARDIEAAFGVAPERIDIVPNGVDTGVFKPRPRPAGPLRLISTASADQPLKGGTHLLRAFADLRREFPELRLTYITKPRPEGETQRLIDRLDLAGAIDFYSGLSTDEMAALYAHADIAVAPSEYEGFGLPAVEAMASGIPLVSSDGGALPEVVGDAGEIVPAADAKALATAISRLLVDEQRRADLSCAGLTRVAEKFTWDKAAAALEPIYARVLEERNLAA